VLIAESVLACFGPIQLAALTILRPPATSLHNGNVTVIHEQGIDPAHSRHPASTEGSAALERTARADAQPVTTLARKIIVEWLRVRKAVEASK
jgi:hypothetical protein